MIKLKIFFPSSLQDIFFYFLSLVSISVSERGARLIEVATLFRVNWTQLLPRLWSLWMCLFIRGWIDVLFRFKLNWVNLLSNRFESNWLYGGYILYKQRYLIHKGDEKKIVNTRETKEHRRSRAPNLLPAKKSVKSSYVAWCRCWVRVSRWPPSPLPPPLHSQWEYHNQYIFICNISKTRT